jgi:hypothetical protein
MTTEASPSHSESARLRMLATEGGPLMLCAWERAFFMHYRVEPDALQRQIPFALDLLDGCAYVSVVAFTLSHLRFERRWRFASGLLSPIARHAFLNVRTYLRHAGEPGIYFMTEWLPNRLSVLLGPRTFGLPYCHGDIEYDHDHETGHLRGTVTGGARAKKFSYSAAIEPGHHLSPCAAASRDEFLLERYTAYAGQRRRLMRFRVWHEPWPQTRAEVAVEDATLLPESGGWIDHARLVAANYSPGVNDVWIGRPQSVRPSPEIARHPQPERLNDRGRDGPNPERGASSYAVEGGCDPFRVGTNSNAHPRALPAATADQPIRLRGS